MEFLVSWEGSPGPWPNGGHLKHGSGQGRVGSLLGGFWESHHSLARQEPSRQKSFAALALLLLNMDVMPGVVVTTL